MSNTLKKAIAAAAIGGSIATPTAADITKTLIAFEGDRAYQSTIGTFRNGKFYPYKDAHGQSIGYGHFIKKGEDFSNGITPSQALGLLRLDINQSKQYAQQLIDKHGADKSDELIDVITHMVFQLGPNGTNNFKNMWKALKNRDYIEASHHMLDSNWAKQTSKRAKILASKMMNIK